MRLSIDLDYTTLVPQADGGWQWYGEDPWTWLHFPPMEGAIEAITHLHEHGHDVSFVTARDPHPVTGQWLVDHGLGWAQVIEGMPNKWELPFDLYLDDSKHVLEGVWKRGMCAVKFCRPNNLYVPCSYEVSNWRSFVTLIERGPDLRVQKHKRVDPYKLKRALCGDRT